MYSTATESSAFSWAYNAQTVHPQQNSSTKRHILGMLTSPLNDSRRWKLCHLTSNSYHEHPTVNSTKISCLRDVKNPCTEIRKFFTSIRMRKAFHVCCFKNGRKWCRISGQKAALHWWQKTRFGGTLRQNPQADFLHFSCVNAHRAPSLMFQISST